MVGMTAKIKIRSILVRILIRDALWKKYLRIINNNALGLRAIIYYTVRVKIRYAPEKTKLQNFC